MQGRLALQGVCLAGPWSTECQWGWTPQSLQELGSPSRFQKPLTESHCQTRCLPEFRVCSPALLSLTRFTEAPGTELFIFNPKLRFISSSGEWERRTPLVCAVAVTHIHCSPAGQPWEETGSPPGRGRASQPSLTVTQFGLAPGILQLPQSAHPEWPGSHRRLRGRFLPVCSGCFLFLSAGSAALTGRVCPVVCGARQAFLCSAAVLSRTRNPCSCLPHPSSLSSSSLHTHTHTHTHGGH